MCFAMKRFRRLRFFNRAFSLLSQLRIRSSNQEYLAIDNAWLAHERGDFQGALQQWYAIKLKFPKQMAGYTGAAATIREAGNLAGATAMAEIAIETFPQSAEPQIERACISYSLGDLQDAIIRWNAIRKFFPGHPACYLDAADALRARWLFRAEADALIRQWHDVLASEARTIILEEQPRKIGRWREDRRFELMSIIENKRGTLKRLVNVI